MPENHSSFIALNQCRFLLSFFDLKFILFRLFFVYSLSSVSHMHLARALPLIFLETCHKLFDVMKNFAQTEQMRLSMQTILFG